MPEQATVAEAAKAIEEDFALFDEYRDKIEYIMDRGKRLPPFPDAQRTDVNKVRGCQSQVWMVGDLDPESGRMRLQADSDAFIVKGLIAMLLQLYDERTPAEILDNPPKVLEDIGLTVFLTPGRSNGLYSMVNRIRSMAADMVGGTIG